MQSMLARIVGISLMIGSCVSTPVLAKEKTYDVVLESSIKGSAEQPKMIFILPWRSSVENQLPLKRNIDSQFDHLLKPVSKVDVEAEFELMKDLQ